jgi:small GTP-binding protein
MDRKALIEEFEEEISTTKYNKATQHHVGLVKAKIARLKREVETEAKKGGKHLGFSVKKQGDATVVFVGFPSVGKSTLLNALTNAKSEVGAYDFTTIDVIPGMLLYQGAEIQLLDIPGLITGAAKGFGRGREVLSVIKGADLIIIVMDTRSAPKYNLILEELYNADIRLNGSPPDVTVKRHGFGGIDLGTTRRLTKIDKETVKGIMRELGFANASIVIRKDITADELVDVLEANRVYIPAVVAMNKMDTLDSAEKARVGRTIKPDIFISSENKTNIEELKELVFQKLGLIRIYMKRPGVEADLDEPMIMHKGATVEDICIKVHRDLMKIFRYAKVWGSSKFPGQHLGETYVLKDKDIVQLVLD